MYTLSLPHLVISYHSFFFLLFYSRLLLILFFFFFNDTAPTEIYTLSLHDALPIYFDIEQRAKLNALTGGKSPDRKAILDELIDRKSTHMNSSHSQISYAVFCLKKIKKKYSKKKHKIASSTTKYTKRT